MYHHKRKNSDSNDTLRSGIDKIWPELEQKLDCPSKFKTHLSSTWSFDALDKIVIVGAVLGINQSFFHEFNTS